MDQIPSRAISVQATQGVRLVAASIAAIATCTSVAVSVIAGLERGSLPSERATWIAIGLVLLLGTHLIPAITRTFPRSLRVAASLLWVACFVATTYSHATFFLAAQRHAGDVRAEAVRIAAGSPQPFGETARPLEVIAREIANVTARLATARAHECTVRCSQLEAQKTALSARLAALKVEEEQARRYQESADAREAERAETRQRMVLAQSDPVTTSLAHLVGVEPDAINLWVAVIFGLLMEGVACLCWIIALPIAARHINATNSLPVSPTPTIPAPLPKTTQPPETTAASNAPLAGNTAPSVPAEPVNDVRSRATVARRKNADSPHSDERLLARLDEAITTNRIAPTVRQIRPYLQCSQARALALRRAWISRNTASQTSQQGHRDRAHLVHSVPLAA